MHEQGPHANGTLLRRSLLSAVGVVALLATATSAVGGAVVPSAAGEDGATPAVVTAPTLPAGFTDTVVMSGLGSPSSFEFAPDGKVFVAERTGLIKVYDNLADTTATVFADLTTNVYNQYDRGLLGLAIDPQWPTRPYVYVLYAFDGDPGGTAPKWGTPSQTWDSCPDPPGANTEGCVISGRLSRLTATGDRMTAETVLVQGWCQQFSSHSVGALKFGPDGSLYASAGEGASYHYPDYGQTSNACADPPSAAGVGLTAPTAEGGSLRSQSPRRSATNPAVLNGTVIRVDPNTGAGVAGNPMIASTDANRRRIIAYGLRNPFRFNFRPGTDELWIGDVGGGIWEEINRVVTPSPAAAYNFGWPCYEGRSRLVSFDNLNLDSCETLYAAGTSAVAAPYFSYLHPNPVVAGDGCADAGGSAITGVSFYNGTSYPAAYQGALFFQDYARGCLWYLPKGADGLPDATKPTRFAVGVSGPVSLDVGPGGDLFYVDLQGKAIHRISYTAGNTPPVAVAEATPSTGALPLAVAFSAAGSTDADGDALSYSWDLDGDGAYGDSTSVAPSRTYTVAGVVAVGLRVTDARGAVATATTTISPGNSPPVPRITAPTTAMRWKVGDRIDFAGGATDLQDGAVPASRLQWSYVVHHCPSGCHEHPAGAWSGVSSGSFFAPDHEYPAHLELILTATDAAGLSASTSIDLTAATSQVVLASNPPGLRLDLAEQSKAAPFTTTAIARSNLGVAAPSPQVLNGMLYSFSSWSDGGAASHNITTPASGTATYTATFTGSPLTSGPRDSFTSGVVDPKVWSKALFGSTVSAAGGQLGITHAGGAWTSGRVETVATHDQRARAVRVRLKRAAGDGAKGIATNKTVVMVKKDATHYASIQVSSRTITARVNKGSGEVNLSPSWPTYDVTAMQWLRFREVAGILYWEYASGTTTPGTWKVLASMADPFEMSAVRLRLSAGSNTTTTDTAVFDSVSTAAG